MKKALYIIGLIVALAPLARAEKTSIMDIVDSSMTVNVITLAAGVPAQVDPVSILMVKRTFLALQNTSAVSDIFCSHRSNVTVSTGFLVPKGGSIVSVPLASGLNNVQKNRLTIFCVSAGTPVLAIIQGY